jgi:hypothetical protein
MAIMLNNYIRYKGYEITAPPNIYYLAANEDVSEWAAEAVENIQRTGIIDVHPDLDLYDPQGVSTRAEAAAVFVRFIEALNNT